MAKAPVARAAAITRSRIEIRHSPSSPRALIRAAIHRANFNPHLAMVQLHSVFSRARDIYASPRAYTLLHARYRRKFYDCSRARSNLYFESFELLPPALFILG